MDLGVRVRCNDDENNSIRLKYNKLYYDNIIGGHHNVRPSTHES